MNKFTYSYPTKVYFGEGSAKEALPVELAHIGNTVMLAYGGGSVKKNGIYDEIRGLLVQAGKNIVEFSGIASNPTYAKVQEGAALVREQQVDFILAAGGGSVIDCCKAVSAQAVLAEDLWELEYVKGKFPVQGIPLGAVVTVSGTGAEMNSGAVITLEEKYGKGGFSPPLHPLRYSIRHTQSRFRPCRCSPAPLIRSAMRWKPFLGIPIRIMCRTTLRWPL